MSENLVPALEAQIFEVTHSPTIGELVKALAKAQLSFKPVLKQVDNEAFKRNGKASKYADLAEYIDATQESLAKNELVVMQWPDVSPDAKTMTIESLLCHGSGEWMRGRLTLPALGRDGFTAQSCGSSITYGRRYSYASITGCASQDDDGNAASGKGSREAAQDVAKKQLEEKANSVDPKIREIAKKGLARMNGEKKEAPKEPPECMTYNLPESFNGHRAYLTNVKEYGEALNEVAAEGLRQILKAYVKSDKQGFLYVEGDTLTDLSTELHEAGVELKKELNGAGA